ncbi:MAG: stage II sporulation protein P [Oscillospiraceae bacterium]
MREYPESFIKARRYTLCAALILGTSAAASALIAGTAFSETAEKAALLSMSVLYGYNGQASADTESAAQSSEDITPQSPSETAEIYTYTEYAVDDSAMISAGSPLMPSSANEDISSAYPEAAADSFSDEDYLQGGKIIPTLYGRYTGDDYIDLPSGGQVRNITSMDNSELLSLAEQPPAFEITADGEPEVLIMHTHTTECYEPFEREYCDLNRSSRVLDSEQNMTAVGNEIAYQLYQSGIGVIHDTTVHDYPDYNGSYDRSRETVMNILRQYPSIKVVLDIHRDAIEKDGDRIAPVTEINGKKAAQVMIICGCDDGTMDMPNYTDNFKFACALQSRLESDYPTLTRPVLFDYRHYNQDLTSGSLLIEVGGHANTLEQAKYSGQLIGKSLAELLLELKK